MKITHLLCAFLALAVCVGCGTSESGGEGSDDDVGDLPDPVDPCAGEDITGSLDAGPLAGTTLGSEDNFSGSCVTEGGVETVFRFTPESDGDYWVVLDQLSTTFPAALYAFVDCDDSEGTELACTTPDLAGPDTPSLYLELTAGQTIYLVVEVEGEGQPGGFELSIRDVYCGDGLVLGDESCDDGNTDAGDGCDASCQWECEDDSFEDDDTIDTALDLDVQGLPATIDDRVLCPEDNSDLLGAPADLFAVQVADGEYVEAQLRPGADGDVACDDMQLSLLLVDSELNLADGPDFSVSSGCSTLAVAPAAGVWYLAVQPSTPTAPPQGYGLDVVRGTSTCGDGIAEGPEACDDGNSEAGDGCENDCTETSPCAVGNVEDLGALEPGSTTSVDAVFSADSFSDLPCSESGGVTAAIQFEVSEAGTLSIDHPVDDPGLRLQLFLSDDGCVPTSLCSESPAPGFGTLATPVDAASYVLAIESENGSVGAVVPLSVTLP